jgi:hypothetical protein
VSKELGPEVGDLSLRDLNPRRVVRKHLLDPIDLDSLDDDRPRRPTRPGGGATSGGGVAAPAGDRPAGDPPRYDPDAT